MSDNMKKICITFLFAVCFAALFGICEAQACVAPVDFENGTMIVYENDVSMGNFRIEMRPTESNYYAVTMEFSLKNNSGEQKTIKMGVPQYFYGSLTKISSFAVSRNGASVKTTLTDMEKNAQFPSNDPYYGTMYVWQATLEADENAFFRSTYTVNTRSDKKNMEYVDIPLKILKYWGNGTTRLEAVLDSTMLNIYTYDRTTSIEPTTIEETGALIWKIKEFNCNSNLSVYYNNDISVIAKYFTNTALNDIQKQAAEFFRTRRYDAAVNFIEDNKELDGDVNYRFMKMVCYEKLGEETKAELLLDELLTETVCFSSNGEYDISEYVKKRLLYEYYTKAKNTGIGEEKLNEILTEGMSTLTESKSSVFMSWANSEIKRNKLVINNMGYNENQKDPVDDIPQQSGNLTAKDWFKQLSQPTVIAVGIAILSVVVFCIFGMFTDKGNKKRNNEKKIKYTKR